MPFCVVHPSYVEHDLGLPPAEESLARAKGKARSVASDHPHAVIVASDQLLFFDGRPVPKPHSDDEAAELLLAMRGHQHSLFTALVVSAGRDLVWEEVVTSHLLMHADLSDEEVLRYTALDHPAGCAGGYKLESGGIRLFSSIDTRDVTAILGLPLLSLGRVLRSLGYRPSVD